MNRTINRVKYFFFAIFLVASLGTLGYHVYFVWPAQNCEADGRWWDPKDHQCATPMPIWRITGRMTMHVVDAPLRNSGPPAGTGSTPAPKP